MFMKSSEDARLTLIRNDIPIIIFKPEVLYAQKVIVDTCKDEVGWVGLVTKKDNTYVVEEIFLPRQGAHGSECEILSAGYVPIEEEMTRRGTFDRMFTDLKFWGHSHVNMGVGPSGPDRQSSIKKATDAGDYFIRAICNKEGRMHLSFFDNAKGVAYENIDWQVDDGVDKKAIKEKFSELVRVNVLPWDVAFPKPKDDKVGSPKDLKTLIEGMGNVPPRLNDNDMFEMPTDDWPIIDKPRKGVRRKSVAVPA
jgi:proteasome lid subunit RPN8/RPN11